MGSVFITLILVGAGGYFGLPLVFPNLNENLTDYVKTEDLTDGGGMLLQTKSNESQTAANIFWNVFRIFLEYNLEYNLEENLKGFARIFYLNKILEYF